ncbi:hypothetical protein GIB67_018354 [Kingdonia uniflora]|uniref:Pectinesterase inhibitor domain-containing protein n=1 Tax=Kingdonia uniflora TaxID=39325 RepID=A0A7J7MJ79_9MAGN|nr:hypothetical protein GIB67_018354 [Kingdonia uniflora]
MSKSIKPQHFTCKHKHKLLIISMVSLLSLTLLLFISLSSVTSLHHPHKPRKNLNVSTPLQIQQACKATRNPQTCETTLIQARNFAVNATSIEIIQCSLWVSEEKLKAAQKMVKTILVASNGELNHTNACNNCLEVLGYSQYRLAAAGEALPLGGVKNARAWLSSSLLYQYDCWSALKYVNDSQLVNETMAFMDSLIGLTSNTVSMVVSYDLFGNDTALWRPPMTERLGFWEDGVLLGLGSKGGFPINLTLDVTVCKVGCEYKSVQEAVDAVPDNRGMRRFVIKIKEGVYNETVRVPLEKKNVVFLGDGMGKTVITGSKSVQVPGITTYNTATVGVVGDGFMAKDLTIENTGGPDVHQAVAFRSESDLSVYENCEFLGNQDTLYVHALRQFYKSCRIVGNVDFIFGNSATIFQDSLILIRPRQLNPEKGEKNLVTAHGRTDPAQSTGFVFQNCVINGTEEYMNLYYSKPKIHKTFLGRPWKEYSRTVFVNCTLGALIIPEGWLPWDGEFALQTLYYGEFENTGLGSNVSARVPWSSQIPKEHVYAYSVQNFIQGNEWIPNSQ